MAATEPEDAAQPPPLANAYGSALPELEVPETGAIFTFGKSKFADNAPSKFWIKKDLILQLSCGDEHTAVVTQSGRLFTFGSNEWGQLGLGHSEGVIKPSCVKSLKPDKVSLVACGKSHTLVYMASGRLLAFGSNADGQLGVGRTLEFTNKPIEIANGAIQEELAQLAAGFSHSMALGQHTGSVYVWGSNTDGQLGLGEDAPETLSEPTRLEFPSRISQISCGYHHSALITEGEGFLYVFGDGDDGKLGLPPQGDDGTDSFSCYEPTKVNLPEKASMVSCGGSHTVVLSDSGQAYSFGLSSNGQLGLGTRVLDSREPALITSLVDHQCSRLSHVSCGENHTAIVSEDGQVFVFGDGRHGKLCLNVETMTNHFTPIYPARFQGFTVRYAQCGGCHTMVFAIPIPNYDWESPPLPAIGEVLRENGDLSVESNSNARQFHRDSNQEKAQQDKKCLPPIKIRPPPSDLPSDPNEIVQIGYDLIKVNGDEFEQEEGHEIPSEPEALSPDAEEEHEADNIEGMAEQDAGRPLSPTTENGEDESGEVSETKGSKGGKITHFFSSLGGKMKPKANSKKDAKDEDGQSVQGDGLDQEAKKNGKEGKKTNKTVRFSHRSKTNASQSNASLRKSDDDEHGSQAKRRGDAYWTDSSAPKSHPNGPETASSQPADHSDDQETEDNLDDSIDDLDSSTQSMPKKLESPTNAVKEAFVDPEESQNGSSAPGQKNHKPRSKTCSLL